MVVETQPLITAVVATYNEERHIVPCLSGLCGQVDLPGVLEIIVVDGQSSDRTVELVRAFAARDPRIKLVSNPRRFQVYAWNIGTREARGRYVAFCSAHTEYADDYLARCFEALKRSGAANVGGVQTPIGEGAIGRSVALAMASPFGIGNAQFRYARKEQFVDAVFGDFMERSVLYELGGFDETVPFNEDSEFYYRLRQAGYRIFMSPTIRVQYHVRSTIQGLAHQMYRYGFWRRRTQLEHPKFVPWRTMAPPMFVLGLFLSIVAFLATKSPFALIIPGMYALFVAAAVVVALFSARGPVSALLLAVVLPVMHVSYGLGWWAGFLVHRRRGARGSLIRADVPSLKVPECS